jgi:pheromone shutdown protein TraB
MITILGTSHVSKRSKKEAALAIADADIVCIELDYGRAEGLRSGREATFAEMRAALGLKTAVMASVMRSLQKKIAKDVGVVAGVEMKAALEEAAKQGKRVFLIDRDIRITMQRLSKNFGWAEATQMVKDLFRRRKIDLHPSDELVLELIEELRKHYPRIYKVMVAERDKHMAAALVHIQLQHPEQKLVAIVGKGHVPGMLKQINYINASVPVRVWTSPAKN